MALYHKLNIRLIFQYKSNFSQDSFCLVCHFILTTLEKKLI